MSDDTIHTVTHTASGSSFRVHAYGATVLSYKSSDGRENLFLSSRAKLDGTKAVRGGIPLVFPIFGPPPPSHGGSTMPQHGYARVNTWKVKEGSRHDRDEHAGLTLTLDLKDVTEGRGENNPWSLSQADVDGTDCRLTYEILVTSASLNTNLIVANTGTDSFDFNALLHTYCAVDDRSAHDPTKCHVHGLGGYSVVDKVDSSKSGTVQSYDDDRDVVLQEGEVDRVHIHPEGRNQLRVSVAVGDGKTVRIESYGEVDETPVPVSCVIWNPGKEKAADMVDFGDDECGDMICVEPGLLGHQPVLAPGKEARLSQIFFAHREEEEE